MERPTEHQREEPIRSARHVVKPYGPERTKFQLYAKRRARARIRLAVTLRTVD